LPVILSAGHSLLKQFSYCAHIKAGLFEAAEGGALARALLLCSETGQNVTGCFLSYAYKLAAEAGYNDCDVVPGRSWEQATASFDWETAAQQYIKK
jgi:hypothetical protein